jgi:CMP-N-acetylneuraminate monooxygenase
MTRLIALGEISDFDDLPYRLLIEGEDWFLTRDHDGRYVLLSPRCPHMGSRVEASADGFTCPAHGWQFDAGGRSTRPLGQSLEQVRVIEREGRLFVEASALPVAVGAIAFSETVARMPSQTGLSVILHAHACVEFQWRDRRVLTDPWLDGPAFLGAWTQYPPSRVSGAELNPTDIIITHEHSDHFHVATLRYFDRSTPVWFPDFPNTRIEQRLRELGFTDLHPVTFGQPYPLAPGLTVCAHEPASLWNDSIWELVFGDFRVLSLNDAGLNQRVARIIERPHLLMSAFSPGASGYPSTWTHLDDEQKRAAYRVAAQGALAMLRQAADTYGAHYLLPFASYFALSHPAHRHYQSLLHRNDVDDVKNVLRGSPCRVLDLLPGETWCVDADRVSGPYSVAERAALFDSDVVSGYLDRAFDPAVFAAHYPEGMVDPVMVTRYFERLNLVPEIVFSEDIGFRVHVLERYDGPELFHQDYQIRGGRLEAVQDACGWRQELTISIPQQVMYRLVVDDESWDEAHIGYWCRFARDPDNYHPGFWRLLQAPYYQKVPMFELVEGPGFRERVGRQTSLQYLVDRGRPIQRVLGRHGMHCAYCGKAFQETLADGAAFHGIPKAQLDRIILELNLAMDALD